MKKNSKKTAKRTAWILGIVGATALSISALASGITGAATFQPPMSINGVPMGPAGLQLNGAPAQSMYENMSALPEKPDSTNPNEHARYGNAFICHKIDANGGSTYYCSIDFTDIAHGTAEIHEQD